MVHVQVKVHIARVKGSIYLDRSTKGALSGQRHNCWRAEVPIAYTRLRRRCVDRGVLEKWIVMVKGICCEEFGAAQGLLSRTEFERRVKRVRRTVSKRTLKREVL